MSIPGFLPSNILNNGQEDHAGKVQFTGGDSNAGAKTLWSSDLDDRGSGQGLDFKMPVSFDNANATASQPNTQADLSLADLLSHAHSNTSSTSVMAKDKYSVLLPTYNERRNLPIITFETSPRLDANDRTYAYLVGFWRKPSLNTTSIGN
jgi:hypothetical protein